MIVPSLEVQLLVVHLKNDCPWYLHVCRSATGRLQFGSMHRATKTAGNQPETLMAGSELFIDYGMHYHVWNAEESHTPFQPSTANALVAGFQAFSRWGFIPDH